MLTLILTVLGFLLFGWIFVLLIGGASFIIALIPYALLIGFTLSPFYIMANYEASQIFAYMIFYCGVWFLIIRYRKWINKHVLTSPGQRWQRAKKLERLRRMEEIEKWDEERRNKD